MSKTSSIRLAVSTNRLLETVHFCTENPFLYGTVQTRHRKKRNILLFCGLYVLL